MRKLKQNLPMTILVLPVIFGAPQIAGAQQPNKTPQNYSIRPDIADRQIYIAGDSPERT